MGEDESILSAETARLLAEAATQVERLHQAVASLSRALANHGDLAAIWLAVEDLRVARQRSESTLRNAQELADRTLDAMDVPLAPDARPASGTAATVRRGAREARSPPAGEPRLSRPAKSR